MESKVRKEYSERIIDHDNNFQRDRIVVIGRRSSGKTVYISMLYDKLWNLQGDIRMKAVTGTSHSQFIKTAAAIRHGNWPAATQGVSQSFIEIDYKEQIHLMVVLDYPGEVFTDAFIRDIESKEVETLLNHIDHASAVMLLVDANHVVSDDVGSQLDNNYGMLQAVNRIQNWPGGKEIPIIFVLTKCDQNHDIRKRHGGTRCFVEKYFSSLIKTTKHLKVCKISVIPEIDKSVLSKDKNNILAIERPLTCCLEQLDELEKKTDKINRDNRIRQFCKVLAKKEKKKNATVTAMSLICCSILLALLIWGMVCLLPSTVWGNLWYRITGQ